ncbi:unnamed protein product [Knipowitschia caucasica]|uniref:Uncharacterized protein n=1 Tax=Knipowitschia caucasica TaxID=637954 RepID=A0AAV2J216_KNICA
MQRAFTFPMTVERSRTKECLEASLAGLCELELRKQKQESLVLGALALGDPLLLQGDQGAPGTDACFSIWGQENLTLRRQLSALQSHPWTLIQSLEQQVGELRIDTDTAGDGSDSRPSSGFYESSEGQSPRGRSSAEPTETQSTWTFVNDRPKSVGDSLSPNGNIDVPFARTTLPRSFSAPYPPLEGIAEEGSGPDPWFWDSVKTTQTWPQHQQQEGHQEDADVAQEEDYQQALRVEGYILSVIHRHTLYPRPCQPRTTLSPDPTHSNTSLHRRTPSLTSESRPYDPYLDLLGHANSQTRGCDLYEGEACGGEAPSLEEDCFLALPYPQSRPHSLAGRLPSPLPFVDPNCVAGALDLCGELTSPRHYAKAPPPIHPNLVNAQFVSRQGCRAAIQSPRHYVPSRPIQTITSPEHQSRAKAAKKNQVDRVKVKKVNGKNRSQSENSLLGQHMLPERRYSTTERPQGRADSAYNQAVQMSRNNAHRRWCSNLELSQDEGDSHTPQVNRRPPRKRNGHLCQQQQQQSQQHYQQQRQQWQHCEYQQRAPLCREEEVAYSRAAPAESESSMSEVYSPGSSSMSSDSDESGGLVWPQQLPPRLAVGSSSSSSPSPQNAAAANGSSSQPKAFVKIKASHALKKKILRFRSGSLKVMTTV